MPTHGIQIISIGTELLLGETVNTNFAFLARALNDYGLAVDREICINDEWAEMRRTFRAASDEAEIVITIGGLGPTSDDLTKEVTADIFGLEMRVDEVVIEGIRDKYRQRRYEPQERSCQRQAQMPAGSTVIPNDWGTAPGCWCEHNGRVIVMLPGPPREIRPMFSQYVLPRIRERLAPQVKRLNLSIYGNPESVIESRTMEVLADFPGVEPSYCTRLGSCLVRLTAAPEAAEVLTAAQRALVASFGEQAREGEVDVVLNLADMLRQRGWMMGTAESCTGGGIGERITHFSGVSDIYAGGVVTYTNRMKQLLLGVREETLREHGAVSEPTAREMVSGLLSRFDLRTGIAVTGIAGPTGGTPEKPVGLVFIATAVDQDTVISRHQFPYDREGVRERTISSALNQLRRQLDSQTTQTA